MIEPVSVIELVEIPSTTSERTADDRPPTFHRRLPRGTRYLDYGRIGPLASVVVEETLGQTELLSRARYGSLADLFQQHERMRAAVAAVTGFRADQVVSQPNTSTGLMHAMFGLTGGVLLSPA